jgi:hypothetical protein
MACHQLHGIFYPELAQQTSPVTKHSILTYGQRGGYILRGEAAGDKLQDFLFSGRN